MAWHKLAVRGEGLRSHWCARPAPWLRYVNDRSRSGQAAETPWAASVVWAHACCRSPAAVFRCHLHPTYRMCTVTAQKLPASRMRIAGLCQHHFSDCRAHNRVFGSQHPMRASSDL